MGELVATLVESEPVGVTSIAGGEPVRLELAGGNVVVYLRGDVAARLCFDLLGAINAAELVAHLQDNPDPDGPAARAARADAPVVVLCGHQIMGDAYCRRPKGHTGFHTTAAHVHLETKEV